MSLCVSVWVCVWGGVGLSPEVSCVSVSLLEALCVSVSVFQFGGGAQQYQIFHEVSLRRQDPIPADPRPGWGLDPWFLHGQPAQGT